MPASFCCCAYPSTIVCVDDDTHLLKWIILYLTGKCRLVTFHDSIECLDFVKSAGVLEGRDTWIQEVWNGDEGHLERCIHRLHEFIYNAERVSEISTLLVDCYMPGVHGLDFCKFFKNSPCKRILLTGEADQTVAVAAFNEEIIDQFVMKGQPQVMEDIEMQIHRMEQRYFLEKSRFISEALLQAYPERFGYLGDLELSEWLNHFLKDHDIQEIYLFNSQAEYLLIDRSHKLWWLSIKNQAALQELVQAAESEFLEEPTPEAEILFEQVKSYAKLPLRALSKKSLDLHDLERILVKPIPVKTMNEHYEVLFAPDVGQANLRYTDIRFVQ